MKEYELTSNSRSRSSSKSAYSLRCFLTDISSRFINLPADQVDNHIESAMKDVCQFLGLELSALWQWSDEAVTCLMMTHLYRPLGGPPVPERMDALEYFPWSLQQVMAGTLVSLSSVDDAPEEASRDKETWCYFGIKNVLVFPLLMDGTTTPNTGSNFMVYH